MIAPVAGGVVAVAVGVGSGGGVVAVDVGSGIGVLVGAPFSLLISGRNILLFAAFASLLQATKPPLTAAAEICINWRLEIFFIFFISLH